MKEQRGRGRVKTIGHGVGVRVEPKAIIPLLSLNDNETSLECREAGLGLEGEVAAKRRGYPNPNESCFHVTQTRNSHLSLLTPKP
jgi:hypothetical protein